MSSLGTGLSAIPSFAEGVNFTEVIGTTISLKSRECSEEGGIAEGLGKASWAGTETQKLELAIRVKANLHKIIRNSPDSS
jgi:hypothetical protein